MKPLQPIKHHYPQYDLTPLSECVGKELNLKVDYPKTWKERFTFLDSPWLFCDEAGRRYLALKASPPSEGKPIRVYFSMHGFRGFWWRTPLWPKERKPMQWYDYLEIAIGSVTAVLDMPNYCSETGQLARCIFDEQGKIVCRLMTCKYDRSLPFKKEGDARTCYTMITDSGVYCYRDTYLRTDLGSKTVEDQLGNRILKNSYTTNITIEKGCVDEPYLLPGFVSQMYTGHRQDNP